MGAALALNIADHGFDIAVYNRTGSVTKAFAAEAGDLADKIVPTQSLEELVGGLNAPRAIILMVPAGPVVDAQIEALRPLLDKDDLIIDAGNANFHDTPRAAWDRVSHIMEAISAKFEGSPCATWMGTDGAGHFVKTVHNGIEYADMQMIAEAYGIMRDGMGMEALAISEVFAKWNEGPLKSYLIEISAEVTGVDDPETGKPILDVILDRAGQKGTGRWTAIEALMVGAPATTIEAAVASRNLSSRLDERLAGEAIFGVAPQPIADTDGLIDQLEQALLAGKIACYAQGFGLLATASEEFGWSLDMGDIARVWREGCIIRSSMLDDMASALSGDASLNLMFAPYFSDLLARSHGGLRFVVAQGAIAGTPVPALSAALAYFDMMRTGRGTANMLQAQRDFFGRHGFERLDGGSDHHGPWAEEA